MKDQDPFQKPAGNVALSDEHVRQFLISNPHFFIRYPDLLSHLQAPERALGDSVVDFQAYQLRSLQNNTKELNSKYRGLIDFCRENLSAQSEVHEAVWRLIRCHNLDQILEVIAVDMPSLFDLDVVRLVVEAPSAEYLNSGGDLWQQSGVTLVEPGVINAALGMRPVRLVSDTHDEACPALAEVFDGAMGLCRSAAMVQLASDDLELPMMLAMAARHAGRFHAGQGVEMMQFLGRIVSFYVERYLADLGV